MIMVTAAAATAPPVAQVDHGRVEAALQLRPGLRMMQVQTCCDTPTKYVLASSLDFSITWTHCSPADHPVTWEVWCRDCDHPTMIIDHPDGSDSLVCGTCYRASTERRKAAARTGHSAPSAQVMTKEATNAQ